MKYLHPIYALALLLLPAWLTVSAQESPDASLVNDAQARFRESAEFTAGLSAFTVNLEMGFEIRSKDGESRSDTLGAKLAFSGSDKARFEVILDEGSMELFFAPDGKFIYISEQKQYVEGSSFGNRQQALTLMPSREFRPAQILLSDLLHNDPSLFEEAESYEIISPEADDTAKADHIRVRGGGITTDFWIRQGAEPLPEKFVMDLSEMAAASNPNLATATITYTFSDWQLTPTFTEDYFAFLVPEGAEEFRREMAEPAADPLEGKPAPQIELPLHGSDGTLNLAAHKGKDVVILDFWASWCGPCRIGLPIASKVAAQFKDKNVVLYAVNIAEEPEQVQAFIEQVGLSATVALDRDRSAQKKYQANSIPKMVIVGKDGIVHTVHTGISPSFEAELTQSLIEATE